MHNFRKGSTIDSDKFYEEIFHARLLQRAENFQTFPGGKQGDNHRGECVLVKRFNQHAMAIFRKSKMTQTFSVGFLKKGILKSIVA